jgi:hypothetical protein
MNARRFTGAHPNAKDRKISIAGQDRASQQKRPAYDRLGSVATGAIEATPRRMSASPRKRTNSRRLGYVRLVP